MVQTKPMAEDKVCQQFVRSNEVEPFCPKIRSLTHGRLGANLERYKPLFPSYIFLKGDLADPTNHHMVRYTRGVNKVLGDGERPVPIGDEVVEIIRARTNAGGLIEQSTYKVGDHIKVRRGYLKDLIGILERPVSDSGRVAVLLNLFNRQMRVALSCADIVKA